jgi:outer membrane receptor protein involved in Fe transport
MPTSFRSRFPGSCLILLGALLAPGLLRGQAAQPIELDPVVTTATRTPAPVRTLGTATEVITAAELARRQVNSFAEARGLAPGASPAASPRCSCAGRIPTRRSSWWTGCG